MEAYLKRRGLRLDRGKESQFNDAWLWVAGFILLLGLVLHIPPLVQAAVLMVSLAAFAWLWSALSLWRVQYARRFSERRAFVGEEITLRLRVENRKPLPVPWLRLREFISEELPIEGATLNVSHRPRQRLLEAIFALRWFQRSDRLLTIYCDRRGYYLFGPTTLEAGDPFGFFHVKRQVADEEWFIIYPRVEPLTALGLPAKNPLGDVPTTLPLFQDPARTIGVRDYQPQDDFRRVHWKATARRQHLQSRVLEPVHSHSLVVVLNVATLPRYWEGVIPSLLERAVSVAASVAYYAAEQRWPVGLIANGILPRTDLPLSVSPGRSPGQLTLIFEMLAAITPIVISPIARLLRQESPRIPWGATVVVITAILDEDLIATLQDLRAEGRRLVLVSLAASPPPLEDLDGVVIYHLPWRPEEAGQDTSPVDPETLAATFAVPHGGRIRV